MSAQEEIKKAVEVSLKRFKLKEVDFLVEKPKEASHGDYSTNVALVVSKQVKKNPMEVARQIAQGMEGKIFKDVQVVAPGFINIFLKDEVFNKDIQQILKQEDFGENKNLKNKKIIVEYTDPNPFKEFHIGHLMSNAIGESISRILEFEEAKIVRVNYQGNVGLHVAKAVWGKKKNENLSWGEAYVFGSQSYEKDEDAKKEIISTNTDLYDPKIRETDKYYVSGFKETLAAFEKVYDKLGTKFNDNFFESEVADFGKKIVEEGLKKGIFETGEKGAIIFKGESVGLHTRVFINSEGLPTYEAKELALAKVKYDKYKYDQSIVITGNEVDEYFKVLLAAMSQIFPELAKKTMHIGHGMMRLPEGKMSSRTGKIVTAEFLIGKVQEVVLEKIKEREFSEAEKNEIAKKVAVGALKYSILKQSIGSNIAYELERSINFQGDSGPYLQYSLARAISVLEKAKTEGVRELLKKAPETVSTFVKMMQYFPEVVQKAGKEYQPHYIATYLTELAHEFNNYYAQNKIVDSKDELSPYKVAITKAFTVIMKNGLWLLGIPVLERM